MKKIKNFLKLIRGKHYVKNLLLFVPLAFAGGISLKMILKIIIGFFSFSFLASSIYIINDIKDLPNDRLHPTKKNRPIASGEISIKAAIIISIVLFILSFGLNYFTHSKMTYLLLIFYFTLNISYSLYLKEKPIADIFSLILFYIIRIYYGGYLVNVPISDSLLLTISSAAAFLTFGKRRNEFKKSTETRKVLKFYTKEFLEKFMYICLGLTLVFYSLWAMEQDGKHMVISIPIVFVIFLKYSLDIESSDEGDPTEVLFKDKVLIILAFVYAVLMLVLLR